MVRPVTWRLWAVLGSIAAVYFAMYFVLATNLRFDVDFYNTGLALEILAPVLFITAYTIATRGGWRYSDLGVNIALLGLGEIPQAVALFVAFAFNHGNLTNLALGWLLFVSPWWQAAFLTWRSAVVLRAQRDVLRQQNDPEPS